MCCFSCWKHGLGITEPDGCSLGAGTMGISRGKLEANTGFIPEFFLWGQGKTTPVCPGASSSFFPNHRTSGKDQTSLMDSFPQPSPFQLEKHVRGEIPDPFPRVSGGGDGATGGREAASPGGLESTAWAAPRNLGIVPMEMGFKRIPGGGDPGEVPTIATIPFRAPPAPPGIWNPFGNQAGAPGRNSQHPSPPCGILGRSLFFSAVDAL